MQIRHRCSLWIPDVTPSLDLAPCAPHQQNGQVGVLMYVAVAQAAAVKQNRMVQQTAIAVRRRSQLLQVIREQFRIIDVDPL